MLREDCVKCRECCKVVILHTRYKATEDAILFFKMRGLRVKPENGYLTIEIDSTCPHLSDQGCKIYLNRPDSCIAYDCSVANAPFHMREK